MLAELPQRECGTATNEGALLVCRLIWRRGWVRWSHRQLVGMLLGGGSQPEAQMSLTPFGWLSGCWGSQTCVQRHWRRPLHPQTHSGTGPTRTSPSAAPILGQHTQPPVLKCGPQRLVPSRPLLGLACPGAERAWGGQHPHTQQERVRGTARCSAHQHGQQGAGPLGTETCHPTVLPRATTPPPRQGCSPWSPEKPLLPFPRPSRSPQPSQFCRADWAGWFPAMPRCEPGAGKEPSPAARQELR